MSVKKPMVTVRDMVKRLQDAAARGDQRARLELAKLRILASVGPMPFRLTHGDQTVEGEAGEVYAPDPVEESYRAGDDLEQADAASRLMPAHVDELAHKAAVKQQRFDQQNAIAPYARINPVSAKNGTLGLTALAVKSGAAVVPVASWVGDNPEDAMPVTITVAPVSPINPVAGPQNGNVSVRPFALIMWGNRTVTQSVKVDVGRGQQLTVCGSSVAVEVGMEAPGGNVSVAGTLDIAGWLSFWQAPQTAPVITTVYVDALLNGAANAVDVNVPPFAKTLLPVQMNQATGSVQLDFKDQARRTRYTLTIPSPGAQITPIPIANDIVFITVTSLGPAVNQDFRLPFQIF